MKNREDVPEDLEIVECDMCGAKCYGSLIESKPNFCSKKCEKVWFED